MDYSEELRSICDKCRKCGGIHDNANVINAANVVETIIKVNVINAPNAEDMPQLRRICPNCGGYPDQC